MRAHEIFIGDNWSEVLSILPVDLETSARACGAVQRLRNVPSAGNLLRMILAYALSDFSLKDTSAWAKADSIAALSSQALHYRLKNGEKWLEYLLGQLLFQDRPTAPTDLEMSIVDATVISGPGSKGTDWVVHTVMDPIAGRFRSVELTDAKGAETFLRHTVNPGEVVLGDRMYGTARGIEFVVNAGADPLVRVNRRTLKICDMNKQRIYLQSFEPHIAKGEIFSLQVLIPVPPDMTERKNKAWDLKVAKSWIPARIVGCRTEKDVTWVLTTVGHERLSDKAVLQLYRLRWQVELLFKRLKSLLHLDDLPTRAGPISKSWLLARLLAAAIAQLLVSPTGLFSPPRGRGQRAGFKSQRLVEIPRHSLGPENSCPWKRSLASHNQSEEPLHAR
jgi:Transposase DDE domain